MRSFWVVDDQQDYPAILAPSYEDAERMFWDGVLKDDYPFDAILIEMILDDDDFEVIPEVDDEDILSIEEMACSPTDSGSITSCRI